MGTAQQENPVATVNTVHTLQLTTEELRMLAKAMSAFNDRDPQDLPPLYEDPENPWELSEEAVALEKLLRSVPTL